MSAPLADHVLDELGIQSTEILQESDYQKLIDAAHKARDIV